LISFDKIIYELDDVLNIEDIKNKFKENRPSAFSLGKKFSQDKKYQKCASSASQSRYGMCIMCIENKHMFFVDKRLSGRTCVRCGCSDFELDTPPSCRLGRYLRSCDAGYIEPFSTGHVFG
jgi:hypothetical protein